MRTRSPWHRSGEPGGILPALERPAEGPHGACRTPRPVRLAEELPELHHGLVELARVIGRDLLRQRGRQAADRVRPFRVPFERAPAGHDPARVRVERRHRLTEREARDRGGDVRTDAGQPAELRGGCRQPPSVVPDDVAGRRVKVPGAGVVARPLPELQHLRERRVRQGPNVGKARDEPLVVGGRLGDPGLLQEDLGDPDAVRVAVDPPGKGAAVPLEPVEERAREPARPFHAVHRAPRPCESKDTVKPRTGLETLGWRSRGSCSS